MRTTECNSNCLWNSVYNVASAWRLQDNSRQHSRTERSPCDLETGSPRPINWQWEFHNPSPPPPPPHRPAPVPSPLRCIHKGTGGSEPVWAGCLRLLTTDLFTKQPVTLTQHSPLSRSSWPCGAPSINKAAGQAMPASSLLERRSHRTHEQCQIPRDSLRQYADVQDAGRMNKSQVQERTVRAENHGCKRHRTTPSVPTVSEYDTQRHWLCSGSHNLVTVQLAEAAEGAKRSHESRSGNNKGHTHSGHALPKGPAIHGNKTYGRASLNVSQCDAESLHDAVKEEKRCKLARGKSWMSQAEQSTQHVSGRDARFYRYILVSRFKGILIRYIDTVSTYRYIEYPKVTLAAAKQKVYAKQKVEPWFLRTRIHFCELHAHCSILYSVDCCLHTTSGQWVIMEDDFVVVANTKGKADIWRHFEAQET